MSNSCMPGYDANGGIVMSSRKLTYTNADVLADCKQTLAAIQGGDLSHIPPWATVSETVTWLTTEIASLEKTIV